MANELSIFTGNQVPAHIAAAFGESNIESRSTVPTLSYTGKVWTVSIDGNKTKLQKKNTDDDLEPVSIMNVIVLDYNKRRGRTYYEGDYDPNKEAAPVCWSDDGILPDASVTDKQNPKCEGCPMSIKGSKVNAQGKAVTACTQHRMIAVVPAFGLGTLPPMRLKIAITSDWDEQSPDATAQGWRSWQKYTEFLRANKVAHTASLVTKIKFDSEVAYPKLFFGTSRWLEPEETAKVAPMTKDPETLKLLGGTWTPAGIDGVKKDEVAQPGNGVAGVTSTTKAAPNTASTDDDDDDGEIVMEGMDAPAAEPVQEVAQAKVAAPKVAKPKAAPAAVVEAAAEAAPAVEATVSPEFAALLDDWGD